MLSIIEPVCAGIMVSLINKYILNGHCSGWFHQVCNTQVVEEQTENEVIEEDAEDDSIPSTTTTVTDASVHVHVHSH